MKGFTAGKHSEAQLRVSGKLTPTLKGTIHRLAASANSYWQDNTTNVSCVFLRSMVPAVELSEFLHCENLLR